jgi:hypothetical protein
VRLLYFSAGVIVGLSIWAGAYYVRVDPRYELVELDGPVPYATLQFGSRSDCERVRKNAELCLSLSDPRTKAGQVNAAAVRSQRE